jgi:hypothetical protein
MPDGKDFRTAEREEYNRQSVTYTCVNNRIHLGQPP